MWKMYELISGDISGSKPHIKCLLDDSAEFVETFIRSLTIKPTTMSEFFSAFVGYLSMSTNLSIDRNSKTIHVLGFHSLVQHLVIRFTEIYDAQPFYKCMMPFIENKKFIRDSFGQDSENVSFFIDHKALVTFKNWYLIPQLSNMIERTDCAEILVQLPCRTKSVSLKTKHGCNSFVFTSFSSRDGCTVGKNQRSLKFRVEPADKNVTTKVVDETLNQLTSLEVLNDDDINEVDYRVLLACDVLLSETTRTNRHVLIGQFPSEIMVLYLVLTITLWF